MRKFVLFLPFLLLTCGNVPLDYGTAFQPFTCGFEDGTTGPWKLEQGLQGLITVVTNPVRKGTNALQMIILPGVTWGSGNRTEISYFNHDPYGEEVYYAWSCMLAPGYTDNGLWQIIGQWHDQPDPYNNESWSSFPKNSPPVSLHYMSNKVILSALYSDVSIKLLRANGVPIAYGQWFDVVFHIKWSMYNDGFIEAWVNGTNLYPERIYCKTVINHYGNYLKLGLYRDSDAQGSNVVYYDEIKIGKTIAEVQP